MWLNTPSVRTAWDDNSFGRLTFPTAYQNRNGAVSQVITITVNKNIFAGCPLNEFEFEATTAALTQHGINTRDFNFVGHYLPQKSPDCNWSTYFWEASFLLIFHPHAQRPFFICTSRGIYHQARHYYSSLFACVTSHYDSSV